MNRRLAATLVAVLALGAGQARAQTEIVKAYYFSRFNDVVKLGEERLAANPEADTTTLVPLCGAYMKLKRYDRMLDCAERLDRRIAAGDHTHSDTMMFPSDITPIPDWIRAAVALDFGDYPRATAAAKAALDKVNPEGGAAGMFPAHAYRVELLPLLALASAFSGDPAAARERLAELDSLDIPYVGSAVYRNEKELGEARVRIALGDYDGALANLGNEHGNFGLALGSLLLGHGDDDFKNLTALPRAMMKAVCLTALGRFDDARKVLDDLLASPRIAEQSDVHWIALYQRARVHEHDGEPAKAIELYERAIEIIERQRSSIRAEASKMGFVGDKQEVYHRAIVLLADSGRAGEAFDLAERAKSRALVDLLAAKTDFAVPEAERQRVRSMLERLRSADEAVASVADSRSRAAPEVKAQIRAASPQLASLVTVSSVPIADLRSLLESHETLVEYYGQGDDLLAFVLSGHALRCVKLDGHDLAAQVRRMRDDIRDYRGSAWRDDARRLYDRLWAPVEGLLDGTDVAVVAHASLHYLPFAALVDPEGHSLIERHALRMLPSASVLRFIHPARGKAGSLLALGNPDLGNRDLDLAFAEIEARQVARSATDAKVLLRGEATETIFKKSAAGFARIHFATHGKFQSDRPMQSGLYLAKDGENDGVLTVGEIYSLSLDADLVTLSACETGLGRIASGDDVIGLTRGFLYAGSRSIVSTLWEVDDRATGELMRRFYDNLAAMPKQEALRQAQLEVRNTFAHPFFWAAFELTGRGD